MEWIALGFITLCVISLTFWMLAIQRANEENRRKKTHADNLERRVADPENKLAEQDGVRLTRRVAYLTARQTLTIRWSRGTTVICCCTMS